jgi:isoamylase
LLFNAYHEDQVFKLPAQRFGRGWTVELCTADARIPAGAESYRARGDCYVTSRSITVLRRTA